MFDERIGKKVKVVFEDDGDSKALFGILLRADSLFLDLELEDGTLFAVNTSKVTSVKGIERKERGNDAH